MRTLIDLNADAGESFGRWKLGDDANLIPHLTSVNVACGWHAGDPMTMRQSVISRGTTTYLSGPTPGFPTSLDSAAGRWR